MGRTILTLLVLAVPASASAAASWSAGDPGSRHPVPFEVLGAASPRAQWLRCDRGGHRCVPITGGVFGVLGTHTGYCGRRGVRYGSCYQVSPRDVGHTLRVRVGSLVSAPTSIVRRNDGNF